MEARIYIKIRCKDCGLVEHFDEFGIDTDSEAVGGVAVRATDYFKERGWTPWGDPIVSNLWICPEHSKETTL